LQNESDEAVQTIPTIGFNVETLQYKNIKVGVILVLAFIQEDPHRYRMPLASKPISRDHKTRVDLFSYLISSHLVIAKTIAKSGKIQ
jgi:hypothetical protein